MNPNNVQPMTVTPASDGGRFRVLDPYYVNVALARLGKESSCRKNAPTQDFGYACLPIDVKSLSIDIAFSDPPYSPEGNWIQRQL